MSPMSKVQSSPRRSLQRSLGPKLPDAQSFLARYATIYAALWKTSVTREMSFKGNFILWIVVELAWFGLQLCFVGVLFSQTSNHWHLDGVAGRAAHRGKQFHSRDLSGVFFGELHEPFRTRPHGENGLFVVAAGQHAFSCFDTAGGHPVVCQCRVRRLRHDFRGGEIAFASDSRAIARLRRPVRRRPCGALLVDVHACLRELLDGARTRHRVGLLQSVQHRAVAGRGVSRRVQGRIYLRAAGIACVQCSRARR